MAPLRDLFSVQTVLTQVTLMIQPQALGYDLRAFDLVRQHILVKKSIPEGRKTQNPPPGCETAGTGANQSLRGSVRPCATPCTSDPRNGHRRHRATAAAEAQPRAERSRRQGHSRQGRLRVEPSGVQLVNSAVLREKNSNFRARSAAPSISARRAPARPAPARPAPAAPRPAPPRPAHCPAACSGAPSHRPALPHPPLTSARAAILEPPPPPARLPQGGTPAPAASASPAAAKRRCP